MSKWLNTTIVRHPDLAKPCLKLDYCPYGQLVEEFPLPAERPTPLSCHIFGHDCPVHYHAEEVGTSDEQDAADEVWWDGVVKRLITNGIKRRVKANSELGEMKDG